jgi:hypothetical protein
MNILADPMSDRGVKQSAFCMARRNTMITMGYPDFVWINANEIISSWYLLGAVCVAPPCQTVMSKLFVTRTAPSSAVASTCRNGVAQQASKSVDSDATVWSGKRQNWAFQ